MTKHQSDNLADGYFGPSARVNCAVPAWDLAVDLLLDDLDELFEPASSATARSSTACEAEATLDTAIALNNRGYVSASRGQYDQAVTDFTASLRLHPQYVEAYNNRGLVWYDLGRPEQALRDFDRDSR